MSIRNVNTSGAAPATASQDNLGYSGVPASRKMAETDLNRVKSYASLINKAGHQMGIDPSIIAAILSRETRGGRHLDARGLGFDGHGYGIMQVDDRYHNIRGSPASPEHVLQATSILKDMINDVSTKHPNWTSEMKLKGGICAYNCGVSRVVNYDTMDKATTGKDYSNDVTARAQYYFQNGF